MTDTVDANAALGAEVARLTERLRKVNRGMGRQAEELNLSRRRERDLARDRDHWHARAKAAEAKLASFGVKAEPA